MEQTRQTKGIWVPLEVWETTDLSWNEKILLMEIDSFTKQGVDCFMSDEYIGKLLGVSTRTAAGYMAKLIQMGYIERTRFDGRRRFVQSRLVKICRAELQKVAEQNCEKLQSNNISIINKNNREKECAAEASPRSTKFTKPTIEQLTEYISTNHLIVNARAFYAHYESKGWKVGRTGMKDWKAALRTWHYRDNPSEGKKVTTISSTTNPYER